MQLEGLDSRYAFLWIKNSVGDWKIFWKDHDDFYVLAINSKNGISVNGAIYRGEGGALALSDGIMSLLAKGFYVYRVQMNRFDDPPWEKYTAKLHKLTEELSVIHKEQKDAA